MRAERKTGVPLGVGCAARNVDRLTRLLEPGVEHGGALACDVTFAAERLETRREIACAFACSDKLCLETRRVHGERARLGTSGIEFVGEAPELGLACGAFHLALGGLDVECPGEAITFVRRADQGRISADRARRSTRRCSATSRRSAGITST